MRTGNQYNHHVLASGIEIRFHQETEVVESMHGTHKPDKSWTHFDSNGHAHAWDGDKLPTLEEVVTGKQWIGDSYDGSEVDISEFHCRVCEEVVEPGYYIDHTPVYVRGPSAYSLVIKPQLFESEWRIPDDDVGPLIDILHRVFV